MKRLNQKQWRNETDQKNALLLKAVDTEVTEAAEERVLNFRISTETVDSYGDVIKSDGWDLARYLKNPVVLWAHSHWTPSIGKALSIGVEDKALVASAEFADAETYDFADTIYRLLKGGFMRATSVGFFPKEWTEVKDDERWGYDFTKQELYEFSVVPVPANPDALQMAVRSGIDTEPMKEWAERVLDEWFEDEETGLLVPRKDIEAVFGELSCASAWVQVPSQYVEFVKDTPLYTQIGLPLTFEKEHSSKIGNLEVKGKSTTHFLPLGKTATRTVKDELSGDADAVQPPGDVKVGFSADDINEKLAATVEILSDQVEDLMAQVDQLQAKLAKAEGDPADDDGDVEERGELFDVIDIQIDSETVENEADRAILDLDIDPEALQKAIRHQMEQNMMQLTGKLPKEV